MKQTHSENQTRQKHPQKITTEITSHSETFSGHAFIFWPGRSKQGACTPLHVMYVRIYISEHIACDVIFFFFVFPSKIADVRKFQRYVNESLQNLT